MKFVLDSQLVPWGSAEQQLSHMEIIWWSDLSMSETDCEETFSISASCNGVTTGYYWDVHLSGCHLQVVHVNDEWDWIAQHSIRISKIVSLLNEGGTANVHIIIFIITTLDLVHFFPFWILLKVTLLNRNPTNFKDIFCLENSFVVLPAIYLLK